MFLFLYLIKKESFMNNINRRKLILMKIVNLLVYFVIYKVFLYLNRV